MGPDFICSLKSGTTEPDELSTLPKRTIEKIVLFLLDLKELILSVYA